MPHPSDLENPAWKALPPTLGSKLLARFNQTLCTNDHHADSKAMCVGLSVQWLHLMKSVHADTAHAPARLSELASFDNATHARVIQNLYEAEHQHGMDEALSRDDSASAVFAGTVGLIQTAADMKDMSLQPRLASSELPFLAVVDSRRRVDPEKLSEAAEAMANADRGILGIYATNGSHAIAFTESTPGKKIVFDPNLGEFAVPNGDLAEVIEAMASASNLELLGVGVQELR